MDLRRYAAALWSAAWLIALSLVLAVVIAVVVASQLPRTFESRATLYVGQSLNDPGLGYTSILASQAVAQSYAQLVRPRAPCSRERSQSSTSGHRPLRSIPTSWPSA